MKHVLRIPRYLCYSLIYLYRLLLRPFNVNHCQYIPSCSEYMLRAIREWGVIFGIYLGTRRLLRCNPWHKVKNRVDHVPINIRGEYKWVF